MINRKKGYWNIFNIIYFIVVTTSNNIFYNKIVNITFAYKHLFFLYQIIMAYDVILFFSLFLFKFKYSPFGRLKRTSFPVNGHIIRDFKSSGRIGFFPVLHFFSKYTIFENGLGINLFWIIKIFIPKDNILNISGNKLYHNLPEIYNPIVINNTIIQTLKTS